MVFLFLCSVYLQHPQSKDGAARVRELRNAVDDAEETGDDEHGQVHVKLGAQTRTHAFHLHHIVSRVNPDQSVKLTTQRLTGLAEVTRRLLSTDHKQTSEQNTKILQQPLVNAMQEPVDTHCICTYVDTDI